MELLQPSRGYFELLAELERRSQRTSARLGAEYGHRLSDAHTLFARGWAETGGDVGAGLGWKWEW